MELLKFNDAGRSPRQRKNPAGFIGAGIMVAVMGLSSTLAGTITIGTGNAVEFGQGVVTAAACDSAITVTPISSFNAAPTGASYADSFTISSVKISGIAGSTTDLDSGCLGKTFELKAYNGSTELDWVDGYNVITVTLPRYYDSVAVGTNFTATRWDFTAPSTYNKDNDGQTLSVPDAVEGLNESTTASTGIRNTSTSSSTLGISFTVTGLRLPSTMTKITVESRAPRSAAGADEAAK